MVHTFPTRSGSATRVFGLREAMGYERRSQTASELKNDAPHNLC